MKLYKFEIKIKSAFATIPKGDTFFGQFCWQIVQNFGSDKLDEFLTDYKTNPFAIISDILPQNSIKKPQISNSLFGIEFDPTKRKEIKAKNIIKIEDLKKNNFIYDKSFIENFTHFEKSFSWLESIVVRNSINRLTSTTDKGFDPFANHRYDFKEIDATFYLLKDDRLSIDEAKMLFEQIGKTGFGKDATIGRGKFKIVNVEEFTFDCSDSNALITLSPSILSKQGFEKAWYEVFTRYGKHGNYLAHSLVWKNPILMADSFALVKSPSKLYIGQALGGDGTISKSMKKTIHQGYAITIPIKLEVKNETVSA
jgi:CRISPR-associated protein Csm4